ncbi:hypothetical protein L3X38_002053 [Prunus dulcis]|uniref:Uncharacterized protein n=1 Tax=Prunus dulcis TaxID=3755 RepID=A0AAD4WTU0_PRUDU|nr:hypothetical protein L3X38_002053 [Prunus dulcis]
MVVELDPKTLTCVLHADGQLLHFQKNPIGQDCHFHILWLHFIISLIPLCASLFHTKKSLLAPDCISHMESSIHDITALNQL